MSNRAKVLAAVKALAGVELFEGDLGPRGVTLTVWTPAGLVWSATLGHCIAAHDYTAPSEAYASLLTDMAHGTETCTTTDCDSCET